MSSRRLQALVASFTTQTLASPKAPAPTPPLSADLPAGISQQLADAAFAQGQWQQAWGYFFSALQSGEAVVDIAHCLLFGGRCALYLGDYNTAQVLLSDYVDRFPTDPEALFYLGKAYQGAHRDFEALASFNAAALVGAGKPKYLAAVAQAAHSLAFQGFGYASDTMPATYLAVAHAALDAALAKDPNHLETQTTSMLLSLDTGDIDKALATARNIVENESKHGAERVGAATTSLALALTRGGDLARLEELPYLKTYPAGRRLLGRARGLHAASQPHPSPASLRAVVHDPRADRWTLEALGAPKLPWPRARHTVGRAAETISIDCDLAVPVHYQSRGELAGLAMRLHRLPSHFAGLVVFAASAIPGNRDPQAVSSLLLRKAAWNELVTLHPHADRQALVAAALQRLRLYAVPSSTSIAVLDWPQAAASAAAPRVVVLSRHGPRLVGGGEQFLRIAGQTYAAEQGADVFFAGLTTDWSEAVTQWPGAGTGFTEGFVYDDADAFRAFCLANGVTAVHVISGLGEFVLDATAGLDIRLVYGVHFWREFIPARVLSRPYYPNVSLEDAKPLPAMEDLLARGDYLYVNSDFCADIARKAYAWSPPVIYSVPVDETGAELSDPSQPAVWPRDFVLLVNARADKGWHLFLDIAERLPEQGFVAIASQSDRQAALAEVQRRGLHNVRVIDRTDRMDELYRAARVVAVPSFTFVETFSRVVIEAGRLARPVLMADSGNLAYLGAGTGLVLPNDPKVWAARIAQLASDAAAYDQAVAEVVGIAERHSADALIDKLRTIPLRADRPRALVCVGSGIGNICHTSPMIRHLSGYLGAPVDVLVAGDFPGSAAAMAGSRYVGQVFERFAHVEQRPYDVVLVTHCFGTLIPAFNAPRVLSSRDFMQFDPAGSLHEAEFNLAFLEAAIGLGYAPEDRLNYFFGGLDDVVVRAATRRKPRIALHAGSKGGIWAAKRWPGFAQLAGELTRAGADVISVGVASEYVEGTLDKTDLSIARMAEELSACDALVTNDSGVMNVANALGLPIVAIFGPTNPATRGPLKSAVRILAPPTECAPCEADPRYKSRFDEGACRCISLIGTPQVISALRELNVLRRTRRHSTRRAA